MSKITYNLAEAIKFYTEHFDFSKEIEFIKTCIKSKISDRSKAAVIVYGQHQYCISHVKMNNMTDTIEKYQPWKKKFIDFEDIYSKISSLLNPFKGRVTLYDISIRLGHVLNLLPDKYVYITSDKVIENTKKILGLNKYPGIKRLKTDFPLPLHILESWQIEDFLCHIEIEETPSGLKYELKERDYSKPFFRYPADVKKEIEPIWKQIFINNNQK